MTQKPGPKPKPAVLRRTSRIPVRCTRAEHEQIASNADQRGLPASAYLRELGLKGSLER